MKLAPRSEGDLSPSTGETKTKAPISPQQVQEIIEAYYYFERGEAFVNCTPDEKKQLQAIASQEFQELLYPEDHPFYEFGVVSVDDPNNKLDILVPDLDGNGCHRVRELQEGEVFRGKLVNAWNGLRLVKNINHTDISKPDHVEFVILSALSSGAEFRVVEVNM